MSEAARAYLADFLRTAGITLKDASRAVGMNDSYLHQYIKRGSPEWLSQQAREALVALYGMDGERLRPPRITPPDASGQAAPSEVQDSGGEGQDQGEVNSPSERKLIDEPSLIELIHIWASIPENMRQLALDVLRNFADRDLDGDV